MKKSHPVAVQDEQIFLLGPEKFPTGKQGWARVQAHHPYKQGMAPRQQAII